MAINLKLPIPSEPNTEWFYQESGSGSISEEVVNGAERTFTIETGLTDPGWSQTIVAYWYSGRTWIRHSDGSDDMWTYDYQHPDHILQDYYYDNRERLPS